ncbi:MAG: site-specific DNA-methyltransferase [Deltaproteobacteria bacterium]|jgi:site-specific DNA-methyltransferase (adenine-specific)|nr:site-specific DNA-methyltransferase [Deltaproteobacteria bacterium]
MKSLVAAKLFCDDCLDGLSRMPEGSVDMVLADPPYGITKCRWDTPLDLGRMWKALRRVCKPNAAMLFFAQCPFDKVLGTSNLKALRYEWVWDKGRNTGFMNVGKMPMKRTENVLVFYDRLPKFNPQYTKGEPYRRMPSPTAWSDVYGRPVYKRYRENDSFRQPLNLITFPYNVKALVHPTQKPADLCEYLIRSYTDPGDTVLDICAGSGTTAVAAVNSGRDWLAFEKEPEYCRIAEGRILDAMREKRRSLFFRKFQDGAREAS